MIRDREEAVQAAMLSRAETAAVINLFNDSVLSRMAEIAGLQRNHVSISGETVRGGVEKAWFVRNTTTEGIQGCAHRHRLPSL